jgi:thiol-disulfide isomerase/thioredoxin
MLRDTSCTALVRRCGFLFAAAVLACAAAAASLDDDGTPIEWIAGGDPAAPPSAAPAGPPPALVPLDEASFDDFLDAAADAGKPVLVGFLASWCGTCRMVSPEFRRAAELARELALPLALAAVDVDASRALTERFGVTTYPTFLLFRNGGGGGGAPQPPEPFPMLSVGEAYVAGLGRMLELGAAADVLPAKEFGGAGAGAAGADELASWLFWRGAHEGKIATTLVLFDPLASAGAGAGAAGGAPEDVAARATFGAVARDLMRNPNLRFAVVRSALGFEDFEADAHRASIVLYKDHDEGRAVFEAPAAAAAAGAEGAAALAAWVQAQNVPLAALVTHKTLQRYRKNVELLALFFVTDAQADSRATVARLLARLTAVAGGLAARGVVRRGNFTLGLANGGKYVSWLHHYGLDGDRLPALVLERPATGELYALSEGAGAFAAAGACDAAALAQHNAAAAAVDPERRAVELPGFCGLGGEAAAAVSVGADGSATEAAAAAAAPPAPAEQVASGAAALTWVSVPEAQAAAWLERAVSEGHGRVEAGVEPAPVKPGGEAIAAAGAAIFEEKISE